MYRSVLGSPFSLLFASTAALNLGLQGILILPLYGPHLLHNGSQQIRTVFERLLSI